MWEGWLRKRGCTDASDVIQMNKNARKKVEEEKRQQQEKSKRVSKKKEDAECLRAEKEAHNKLRKEV